MKMKIIIISNKKYKNKKSKKAKKIKEDTEF